MEIVQDLSRNNNITIKIELEYFAVAVEKRLGYAKIQSRMRDQSSGIGVMACISAARCGKNG